MSVVSEASMSPIIKPDEAFSVANKILEKWGCSVEQKLAILSLSKRTFYRYQKDAASVSLSDDQLERISCVVGIHATLRAIFSNADNVYGYMSMKNDNPYFNGRSPLSIISSGRFGYLYEVFKRIESIGSY